MNNSVNVPRSKTAMRSYNLSSQKVLQESQSSAMNIVEEYGISGYTIAKHVLYDNPNKNVANWKNGKILPKGKKTFFDDEIKNAKDKVSP